MHADLEFYRNYYGALRGATITDTAVREEDGEPWPVLTVKLAGGEVVEAEVSRDEEGNGPGFLFGLPVPAR